MLGRLDLAQYENGCKQLTNWWPKVTGGMRRRPGSLYLAERSDAHRIESFVFSEDQTYLICFWHEALTVNGGVSIYDPEDGSLIQYIQITPQWDAARIKRLKITQAGDVMFCCDYLLAPFIIRRTSATTFVVETFVFESKNPASTDYPKTMPFWKYADSEVTISVNGYLESASVTVTASAAVFDDRHVGNAIRYRQKQLVVTSLPGGSPPYTTCTATIYEDLDRGAVLTFDPLVHSAQDFLIDEIIVGRSSGIKAQVIDKSNTAITVAMIAGVFPAAASEEVEGLTSGNIATITANSNVDPVASPFWDEEAFTDEMGWPSVIEFHSQRLWLAGSSSLPAHIFGSRASGFFNFDVGDAFPADSIQAAISDNQVNKIVGIVSGRHLQVFTDAGEFYAPQSEDLPLTPTTFDLRKQTRYGSKESIQPKLFDESTIFAQAQGNAVREFIWIDNQRGYSSDAISLIAEEYLSDVQEIDVLYGGYDRPEQICFFVNGDGTITWYHAARAEGIRTWGKWETDVLGGGYISITVIQDKLYALVRRIVDNVARYYLERFELDVTLDCATQTTTTVAKSLWVGPANHLTDTEIQVGSSKIKDNHDPDFFLGKYNIPSGGTINLAPIEVDNITCGLGFTQTLETMPIEVKDQNGVTGGMPKRLVSGDVYMASTLAAQLQGNRISTFLAEGQLGLQPEAITGVRKFYLLGYSERPTLLIENEIPVPCEVLSLGAEVEY